MSNTLLVSKPNNRHALFTKKTVLSDFEICCISRETSLLGRREVLSGKAKFGIFGAGKELPQVAMAHFFKKGDFRAGYYRDQTFMLALGLCTIEDLFAQLYADTEHDPFSGGRQMNNHFSTPFIDENGQLLDLKNRYNISADISSTAGQMPRALGLALASKKYRENKTLTNSTPYSNKGNEVTFCTIGDASTSEGVFWEAANAAGVMQVPLAISVWDDGFGISVPIDYQTTKGSISEAIGGLQYSPKKKQGLDFYAAEAWNYEALIEMYKKGIPRIRKNHIPALFHVKEVTQPQGHSTSGSHERYKSEERLQFEHDMDCISQFRKWIVKSGYATHEELDILQNGAKEKVKVAKQRAWKKFTASHNRSLASLQQVFASIPDISADVIQLKESIRTAKFTPLKDLVKSARRMTFMTIGTLPEKNKTALADWLNIHLDLAHEKFSRHLCEEGSQSSLNAPYIPAEWNDESPVLNGHEIIHKYFEKTFEKMPELYAFGEDVGRIGDVNQGLAGLQAIFGKDRIFDTGIREWTIIGQAVGMSLRGLRPIAEIQYLDYLIYGLQPMMDDLATLRYRSNNTQQAPAIIRTRGHRLEGIWHSGSPLGMILNAVRGMYVLVPRNMTQAAGFYNTLLQGNNPALVIECLNGYRLKEKLPSNMGVYNLPLGVPEIMLEGTDITLVTYGSCVRIAQDAIKMLEKVDISIELVDVQSLLPFDLEHRIAQSVKKTNALLILDEDVPGGASAFILQKILEEQKAYLYLDSQPRTLTAKEHRPAYGDDGNYFSKPNSEDVFNAAYEMMNERDPEKYVEY